MDASPGELTSLVHLALLDLAIVYFKPHWIILFGSVARKQAELDSDIDLLVIVDDDTPPEKTTLKAGYQAGASYHQPADVIPVRAKISQRNSVIPGTLLRAAVLDELSYMSDPSSQN